jgi:hypothetical protein
VKLGIQSIIYLLIILKVASFAEWLIERIMAGAP